MEQVKPMGMEDIMEFVLQAISSFPRKMLMETGGGMTHTGNAQCIAGVGGQPLKPIWKPFKGHACAEHAGFIPVAGMEIAVADRAREGTRVDLYTVIAVGEDQVDAEVVSTFYLSAAGWLSAAFELLPQIPSLVVVAAAHKAGCYHCREAHYSL